jgi:hypothetical protein
VSGHVARGAGEGDGAEDVGRQPEGPFPSERAIVAFAQLLSSGDDRGALELAAAAAPHDERFARIAAVVSELRAIHFGIEESSVPAEPGGLTRTSLRLLARLRPHARGTLTHWERSLLLSLLTGAPSR